MPDRISRPAARLSGGLPDGLTLNGLAGADGKHFLKGEPAPRYAVVKLGRTKLVHDDEAGSDVAVLKVLELEVPADAGQLELERLILSYRDIRTSDGTLPFHQPAYQSNDAERSADLRHRIQVWCDLNQEDPTTAWRELFGDDPDAPVGPTGASITNLLTFCEEKGIPTKDEREDPDPYDDDPDDYAEDDDDEDDGPRVVDVDLPSDDQPGGNQPDAVEEPEGDQERKVVQFSGR